MTTTSTITVRLPVLNAGNEPGKCFEELEVEQLGVNLFRLRYSPGMVEGLANGDVFEIHRDLPLGYQVLTRSRNICVWFHFPIIGQNRSPDGDWVVQSAIALDGWCDGIGNHHVVLTFPSKVSFLDIETLMERAVTRFDGSTWQFGNVYDPMDGVTPLNWWKNS